MTERELQRDPATLRVAHHICALDLQGPQQRRGIVGELLVRQLARGVRGAAVPLLIKMITARLPAKAATHDVIESVAMNAPGMSSNGAVLDLPSSPYTS